MIANKPKIKSIEFPIRIVINRAILLLANRQNDNSIQYLKKNIAKNFSPTTEKPKLKLLNIEEINK